MEDIYRKWLIRAHSNLERARQGKATEYILYEDLCFDCQQCAEKSLKALLIYKGVEVPRTHNIRALLSLISEIKEEVPLEIKRGVILNEFAVNTRYPGEYEPVDEEEYLEALELAEKIYNWALINTKNLE